MDRIIKLFQNKKLLAAAILLVLFLLFTLLVKVTDVMPIGPEDSLVGFSALNEAWHKLTGVNMGWYYITQVLGYFAIALAAFFAVMGVLQLIWRKSVKKVDRDILLLGALYLVVIIFYIFFEKVAVNYRPILLKGVLEPSYPSSHTMLAVTVFVTAFMQFRRRVKNKNIRIGIMAGLTLLLVLTVIGRLFCGVHWFTDIIGGLLLSGGLVMLYSYFEEKVLMGKGRENAK